MQMSVYLTFLNGLWKKNHLEMTKPVERWQLLHPVILPVSSDVRALSGPEKQKALSTSARKALFLSAELSEVVLGELQKGDRGNPLPSNGIYWSVSCTLDFAAAVAAPFPVGVDIEKIKNFTHALQLLIAAPEEWRLGEKVTESLFCRFWTAKEAVLKVVGEGLRGLSRCSIAEIVDENHLRVTFGPDSWTASQFLDVPGHIASVSVSKEKVKWHLLPVDTIIR